MGIAKRIWIVICGTIIGRGVLLAASDFGFAPERSIANMIIPLVRGISPETIAWFGSGLIGLALLAIWDWYQYRTWLPWWPAPNVRWLDNCGIGKGRSGTNPIQIVSIERVGICKTRKGLSNVSGYIQFEKTGHKLPLKINVRGNLFDTGSILHIHGNEKFCLAVHLYLEDGTHPTQTNYQEKVGDILFCCDCEGTEYKHVVSSDRVMKEIDAMRSLRHGWNA